MIPAATIALVRQLVPTFGNPALDPALICAIIEQESSGVNFEIRFEPAWYARTDWDVLLKEWHYPRLETPESERTTRSMSWGLMQVLGQSAREAGFVDWLPGLCDPTVGITIGCKVFARKLAAAGGNVTKALELWNGGGNPNYAAEVLAKVAAYKS